MSIRENIQIHHTIDIDQYMETLREKHGMREHTSQNNLHLLDDVPLPFHRPQWNEDHIFILGANWTPLSPTLIQILVETPGLAPPETRVIWTQEQEIIFDGTLDTFRTWLEGS